MVISNRTVRESAITIQNCDNYEGGIKSYMKYRVDIPMNVLQWGETGLWCVENCTGKFGDNVLKTGKRTWGFENEQDAILFALKWL